MFEKGVQEKILDKNQTKELTILIVHARWNIEIIDKLVKGAKAVLADHKVTILVHSVPGAYELPFACQSLMMNNPEIDACIAVGVLIKGSTMHFEYICDAVSNGLMNVQLKIQRPVVFGVLTCLTAVQAMERAGENGGHNHGEDWAKAAMEMALLKDTRISDIKI